MSQHATASRHNEQIGIMSRTLGPSPTLKYILPARIRSKSQNDIIFVGETCIQLREFHSNGQLEDATGKLLLSTQILSAKVISARLEAVPTLEAILDQDTEEERYVINGQPIDEAQPPEILVLSTTANELIYAYAKDFANGSTRFIFARRPLLGGLTLPEKYGNHMAIDPESRALAIAPLMGYCTIFTLKPVDEIRAEIDAWKPTSPDLFVPVTEQRFVQVNGSILKMEFLKSPENDPTKVLLVLLVANHDVTQLLLYRWDSRFPLHEMRPLRCSGQKLPQEDAFPLMLIPSARNTSFILVTETGLALYDHVTSTQAKRIGFLIPKESHSKAQNTGSGPLWVQWAKPRRHRKYKTVHDDIVLVREDGLLLTYLISEESPMKIKANFSPGSLGINVDTAFCMLAGPPQMGGDILIAGGDLTDGGVFHVKALNVPERTQTLANIAPVQDMVLVDDSGKINSSNPVRVGSSDRVFMCCGKKEGLGALVELRYGLEAQIGWTMSHPDSGSIDQFWSLEIRQNSKLWLLSTHSLHTSLVIIDLPTQEMEFADASSGINLDFDMPTLAAGVLDEDIVVQITRTGINLFDINASRQPKSQSHKGFECIRACIDEGSGMFSAALRTQDGFEIVLALVCTQNLESSPLCYSPNPISLKEEPVSMFFTRLSSTIVLFVGTEGGILYGFHVENNQGLKCVYERKMSDWEANLGVAAISSLCVLAFPSSKLGLLLCGLRNGLLVCVELTAKFLDSNLVLDDKLDAQHQMGVTTVTLSQEKASSEENELSALVLCVSELRRVRLFKNDYGVDYDILSLWITNRNEPVSELIPANAIHRVQRMSSIGSEDFSKLIICATAEDILFCSLVNQPQIVLRRRAVKGRPKRIIYSKYLKRIVVAAESEIIPSDPISGPLQIDKIGKRPTLELVDANRSIRDDESVSSNLIDAGEAGERIRCLINWSPTDGQSHFEMLVLALDRDEPGTSRRTGRVICISAKTILKGKVSEAHPKVVGRYPGKPATSVCAVGRSSLAVAAGNEIILYNLEVGTRRWSTLSKYTLPSPALSLTVQGSLIFVATAFHSLLILEEQDNKLNFYASDVKARTASNVLTFDTSSTLITAISDHGTNVMGFTGNNITNNVQQILEAQIPLILDRIREDRGMQERNAERHIFYGSTTDGTLFQFTTLKEKEWKLLQFMRSLCDVDRKLRKTMQSKPKGHHHDEMERGRPPQPRPAEKHIRGDLLNEMIEPGPYNLRKLLLGDFIKYENQKTDDEALQKRNENIRTFKDLASPLVGDTSDPIAAVTIWLRKLMNHPPVWSRPK